MDDGGVRCWGQRMVPGDDNPPAAASPVQMPNIDDAIDIDLDQGRLWVLAADGRVRVGDFDPRAVQTGASASMSEVRIGERARALARAFDTLVLGESGQQFLLDDALAVRRLSVAGKAIDVRAGRDRGRRTLLFEDGHIAYAGAEPLPGIEGITALFDGSCGRHHGGEVLCWDHHGFDFEMTRRPDVRMAQRADDHGCELGNDDVLRCTPMRVIAWGSEPPPLEPVEIPRIDTLALRGGQHPFACAITADDATVMCWGDNCDGQLGDGTLRDHPRPLAVLGLDAPALPPALDGRAAQPEDGPHMPWAEAPASCSHAAALPLGEGTPDLQVVSAYAHLLAPHHMRIRIADFRSPSVPPAGHRSPRGSQRELELELVHEIDDRRERIDPGEYNWLVYGVPTCKGRAVAASLYEGDSQRVVSDGLVLRIDTLTSEWVCGEIQQWRGIMPLAMHEHAHARFAARIVALP